MRCQQRAAFLPGCRALRSKLRVAEHFLNRHAGRLEAAEEFDPCQHGRVVDALARAVPRGERQQSDSFVIADRVRCEARVFRDITDFHGCVPVRLQAWWDLERTLSQACFYR